MLVTSREMINRAQREGYAIGSFNVSNLESVKAVIAGLEKKKSPGIIATTEKSISYAGLPYIFALLQQAARLSSVPIAIHLDHGKSLEMVKKCLQIGYTSIMIDGSALSFEENVKLTKEVVNLSKSKDIPVEGEIGRIEQEKLTNPIVAQDFVEQTKVDFVAVALGTAHGFAEGEMVDLDQLARIRDKVKIPLVLHGGSGVPEENIRRAIKKGICKINIDTDIRLAFIKGCQQGLEQCPVVQDHREILSLAMEKIQKVVEEKVDLFGSAYKFESI